MKRLLLSLFILTTFVFAQITDLFFSEWGEGSSNNKYLEIYNGTGAAVDLSNYSISKCTNGCDTNGEWDYPNSLTFAANTIVADGDVYVVYDGSANASIVAEGDQAYTILATEMMLWPLRLQEQLHRLIQLLI